MPYLVPLWITMTVITIGMSFLLMKLDVRHMKKEDTVSGKNSHECRMISSDETGKKRRIFFLVMGLLLMFDIVVVVTCDVSGDDALTLITGTVLVISGILCLLFFATSQAASKFIGFMTKGFGSAMEMFAPAVIIIAFFSIGNQETAQQILGEDVSGILSDLVHALVSGLHVPELCLPVVQSMAGILYSMDGSGFAGLTVIGEIAQSYHVSGECAKILTSLGQIVIIWRRRDCDPLGCDPGLCNMRSVTARTCKEKSHPGNHQAANEWTQENDKHYHKCIYGCDTHLDETDCSGGTATCSKKATCTVCSNTYGALGTHRLSHQEEKAATCTEAGNIAYWHCSVCMKNFLDQAGRQEASNVALPVLEHTYGEWTVTKAPTSQETGIKTKSCVFCGHTITESSRYRRQ